MAPEGERAPRAPAALQRPFVLSLVQENHGTLDHRKAKSQGAFSHSNTLHSYISILAAFLKTFSSAQT